MPKIAIYTQVYNGEKTLRRAIESVLAQTYTNFTYFIGDNASTDGTRAIINEYVSAHDNVHLLAYDVSPYGRGYPNAWTSLEYIRNREGFDWFCWLDADDEYKPTFFEDMLEFAHREKLDMAVSSHEFYNVGREGEISYRKEDRELIIQGKGFDHLFPRYHQHMRTTWAKLISMSVLQSLRGEMMFCEERWGDTQFSLELLTHCKRAGISDKVLHRYYVYPESASYQLSHPRIGFPERLHLFECRFLLEKTGYISSQNKGFLLLVYFYNSRDVLEVIRQTDDPMHTKLENIWTILSQSAMRDIFAYSKDKSFFAKPKSYLKFLSLWILSERECLCGDCLELTLNIILRVHESIWPEALIQNMRYLLRKAPDVVKLLIEEDYDDALKRLQKQLRRRAADDNETIGLELSLITQMDKSESEQLPLLFELREKYAKHSAEFGIDAAIRAIFEKYPLLEKVGNSLAASFLQTADLIMQKDYQGALDAFISASENIEIDDSDVEDYFTWGQHLSAAAEDMGAYIYFKKLWISYLIDVGRNDESGRELDEFLEMFPDDQDFIGLKARFEGGN